jgi:hypothetical protein
MVCGGMLAFDGGALALIAIRCTGIAPNERGRFARIGGPRSADVARRSFRRCSASSAPSHGAAVLRLEIPGYYALTSALLTAQRICEPDALDRVKVEAA